MNGRDPADRLLRGLESPSPPAELRAAVLEKAASVLLSAQAPDLWSRIWESRGARLAWSLTALALLVAHFAIPPRPGPDQVARPATPYDEELESVIDLPPIHPATVSFIAESAVPSSPVNEDDTHEERS